MSYLGSSFYRLEMHSFDHGIAVEERGDLAEIFGLMDARHLRARGPVTVSNGVARFMGETADGAEVRIVLSRYVRAELDDATTQRIERQIEGSAE